jgi:8-oxo-dGTP diphosphatase
MELQVGVKILITNSEGKVLLLRRSREKYPEIAHQWDIPGGRINPGMSLLENLAREVKEETRLVLVGTPVLIGAQDIFPSHVAKHVVRVTYRGLAEGEVILSDEHDEYQYVTEHELGTVSGLDTHLRNLLGLS